MSTREFWNEEPELLWAYRKSYIDQLNVSKDIENYKAWLNGLYVFDAVSKCIYNSFGRKETQQALNYIEKPYDFYSKTKTKEEVEKEERLRIEEQIKERNKKIKEILDKKVGENKG